MKAKILPILIANLFAVAAPAIAQETGTGAFRGMVGIGGQGTNVNAKDEAKFNEYRDMSNGVLSVFDLKGRGDQFYLDAFGENFGRTDQYIDVRGGMYGIFKGRVYSNYIPHNFGWGPNGGRTPYAGSGNADLIATFPQLPTTANPVTGPFPNSNVPPWNSIDFGYERRDNGLMFELSANTPFYARAEANEVTLSGLKATAAAQGTSPGQGFVDLPTPVEYKTKTYFVEGGYQSKAAHFAVNWTQSKFENGNEMLRWSNGYFSTNAASNLDASPQAPDNTLTKIAMNGVLRQLPFNSTLSGRYTYSKLDNNVGILSPALNATGSGTGANTGLPTGLGYYATNPNPSTFDGNIKTQTASLAFSSNWTRQLDSRIYWNWLDRENNNSEVNFTGLVTGLLCTGTTPNGTCSNGLFAYKKNNFGGEVGYRINANHRLLGGYDWLEIKREDSDAEKTTDNRFWVQWNSNWLDNSLLARVKYQYLDRDTDFLHSNVGVPPSDPLFMVPYVSQYSWAPLKQNLFKLTMDWSPIPLLDLGLEAYYKDNDYKDTVLGRTSDKRQQYYGSIGWGDPSKLRLLAFGDYEQIKYDSYHRSISNLTAPDAYNPNAPATAQNYNWDAKNTDKNWLLGLGADWAVMQSLTLKASYLWSKTNGNVDFTPQTIAASGLPAATFVNISNYDNTRRQALVLSATWAFEKNWSLMGGYSYEKYSRDDIQYNNYLYTIPAAGRQTSYLSGVYAYPDYTANIFFARLMYKF